MSSTWFRDNFTELFLSWELEVQTEVRRATVKKSQIKKSEFTRQDRTMGDDGNPFL